MPEQCRLAAARAAEDREHSLVGPAEEVRERPAAGARGAGVRGAGEHARPHRVRRARHQGHIDEDLIEFGGERTDRGQALGVDEPEAAADVLAVLRLEAGNLAHEEQVDAIGGAFPPALPEVSRDADDEAHDGDDDHVREDEPDREDRMARGEFPPCQACDDGRSDRDPEPGEESRQPR